MIYSKLPDDLQCPSKSVLISYDESMILAEEIANDYKSFEILDNDNKEGSQYKSIGNDHNSSQGYIFGITCAVLSSVCYASNIVFGKLALRRNPMLTTYDINFVRAIVAVFVTSYQVHKNNVQLTKCSKKALILLIACNILGACRCYPTVWAYKYISATKCILIINTCPLFVIIIGGLFLSEKVTYINYLVGLSAIFGCYVLTLSKSDESVPNSNPLLGYIFAFIACLSRAGNSSMQRVLSNIWHYMVFPFYFSFTLFLVSLIAWIFFDGLINIGSYDLIDVLLLICTSFGTTFGLILIGLSLKYLPASTAAPIANLEVAFGFIADVLIFHYEFYFSDFLGACIIFSALGVHIMMQCYK
ncbi:unnamed protein product [Moneuplotes crassus]|uniref:EamA domain-containing protein n=1 Tax=Euplotes crassus TaxID=5936 RepID=A0AAD2CX06_EUPCR|nr:unnamed protein product [Moneuplotes crassus]